MKYASTTTLNAIRAASPCMDGWAKLLKGLGKTSSDGGPLYLITVLEINGLDDALWVLSYAMPDDRLARHFRAWCADQVLHLFEAEYPDDTRVREQITMLRNDAATEDERAAARDAARVAAQTAAWSAARVSARVAQAASWCAAQDAARNAAQDAAQTAAWSAARVSARVAQAASWCAAQDAARNAAWDAIRDAQDARDDAARVAAHDAAQAAQEMQLRKMLGE